MKVSYILSVLLASMILVGANGQFVQAAVVKVSVNGVNVQFDDSSGYPFIDSNNRTMVPLRVTMEAAGMYVDWRNETQTAIVVTSHREIRVPIGENYIVVNGENVQNDTAAVILDGRTYLPIRAVFEAAGFEVEWVSSTQTVAATTPDNEKLVYYNDVSAIEKDLAEREIIDRISNEDQDALDKALDELYSWISEAKLNGRDVSFMYGFSANVLKKAVGFYTYGSLSGSVGSLLYAVPDFDDSLNDGETKVYNGITIKKDRGVLYFNIHDLENLGIIG